MSRPNDWQVLAVALLRRLGGKVEFSMDELADARERLDPVEYETLLVAYRASLLEVERLTVELRCRPREVPEAIDALVNQILKGAR